MKFSGVDFSQMEEVAAYDDKHKKFRDYAKASEEIIQQLSLNSNSIVVDLGCGTGAFAIHAANKCRTIYAVDASAAMLAYCRKQAEQKGLSNIVYCHSGLLSYEHGAELADARLKQDAIIHVKNEFSTYDWIMEGMIRRS